MSRIESLPREAEEARAVWFSRSKSHSISGDFGREMTLKRFHYLIKNRTRMRLKMRSRSRRSDSRVSRAVLNGSLFNSGDPFVDWPLEYGRFSSTCWILTRTSDSSEEEACMEKDRHQILRGEVRRTYLSHFGRLDFVVPHFSSLITSKSAVEKKDGVVTAASFENTSKHMTTLLERYQKRTWNVSIQSTSSILCRQLSRDAYRLKEFNRPTSWYSSGTIHIYCKVTRTSLTEVDRWSDQKYPLIRGHYILHYLDCKTWKFGTKLSMCGYDGKKTSHILRHQCYRRWYSLLKCHWMQCAKNSVGYQLRVDSTTCWSNEQDNVFEVAAVESEEFGKKAWRWDVGSPRILLLMYVQWRARHRRRDSLYDERTLCALLIFQYRVRGSIW